MRIDWRLYYVLYPDLSGGRGRVAHTLEPALLGVATVVPFRDIYADDAPFRQCMLACPAALQSGGA